MSEYLEIDGNQIVNQQRFPIKKYNWPLKKAALSIIKGNETEAYIILKNFYDQVSSLNTLNELYDIKSLSIYNINSIYTPWFHKKPILTKKLFDKDFRDMDVIWKKILKLKELTQSIIDNNYVISTNMLDNIIVYPINIHNNLFYVRRGNHRSAILSALKLRIPCFLDKVEYLKPRDKLIFKNGLFNDYTRIKSYPKVSDIINWPSVQNGILKIDCAEKIANLFDL